MCFYNKTGLLFDLFNKIKKFIIIKLGDCLFNMGNIMRELGGVEGGFEGARIYQPKGEESGGEIILPGGKHLRAVKIVQKEPSRAEGIVRGLGNQALVPVKRPEDQRVRDWAFIEKRELQRAVKTPKGVYTGEFIDEIKATDRTMFLAKHDQRINALSIDERSKDVLRNAIRDSYSKASLTFLVRYAVSSGPKAKSLMDQGAQLRNVAETGEIILSQRLRIEKTRGEDLRTADADTFDLGPIESAATEVPGGFSIFSTL